MDFTEILTTALSAARAAAAIHQQHVGRVDPAQWSRKGTVDFATFVDHEAEACIVDRIRAAYPQHEIMAEEAFSTDRRAGAHGWRDEEWLWLVDPLDGTTNFLHGYPMYSASVAAAYHGEIVAAAVVCGPSGDEWCATLRGGATRNGEPIRVSSIDRLDAALIGTGFPFKNLGLLPGYLEQFDRVMRHTSGVRRAGSAALDLCHVASGYFDGFWELDLFPWDFAAGALLIREAGGSISGLNGELDLFSRGGVIAGNPHIHPAITELVLTRV